MQGKRSCVLRTSSSRSLLVPADDAEGEPATFWKISQVTDKSPSPQVSAPRRIVVGFDIGSEKKPTAEVCESPRSVLESFSLVHFQENQQVVARSLLSGLGNLLAAKSGSCGGRAVGNQIFSVEMVSRVGSFVAGSFKATFGSRETCSDEMCLSVNWSHWGSDAVWFDDASNLDFMDADIFSGQRQTCVEDERLDADISPQQNQHLCQGMFAPCSQDMNVDIPDMNTALSQAGATNSSPRTGLKNDCLNAGVPVQCGQASWKIGEGLAEIQVSPRKSGMSNVPGSDDCKDIGMTPQPTHISQRTSSHMERCKGVNILPSIFSTGSPPPCFHSQTTSSSGFLKMCALCGHSLRLGKDVFMYRGDQAFCSAECRYHKIVSDEGKAK